MKPQLITLQTRANEAAEKFKKTYFNTSGSNVWNKVYFGTGNSEDTYKQLVALGEHPDPEDVIKVLNASWIVIHCDGCGKSKPEVVIVGEPANWESATARLCEECAREALALFTNKGENK